jgi:hypothetical protein
VVRPHDPPRAGTTCSACSNLPSDFRAAISSGARRVAAPRGRSGQADRAQRLGLARGAHRRALGTRSPQVDPPRCPPPRFGLVGDSPETRRWPPGSLRAASRSAPSPPRATAQDRRRRVQEFRWRWARGAGPVRCPPRHSSAPWAFAEAAGPYSCSSRQGPRESPRRPADRRCRLPPGPRRLIVRPGPPGPGLALGPRASATQQQRLVFDADRRQVASPPHGFGGGPHEGELTFPR